MAAEGEPQTVLVVLAEADPAGRSLLREALRSVGFANIRDYSDVASVREDPACAAVDFLIVGADLDGAFELVRDIRHARFGENPFALVMAVVAAAGGTELAAAVSAGVDEVVTRPLKEAQLMARLRRGGVQRTPFVATSDFIGPDRRVKERQGALSRLSVPNVLADKPTGRSVLTLELARHRLAAHGLRLAMLSRLMSEGVGAPMLDQLAPILADAAGLAAMLGEPEVELLCRVLTARSGTLPAGSTVDQAGFVSDLAEGLVPVLRPGLSAAEHISAAERAASSYHSRPRAPLGAVMPFGGRLGEPAVDVPAVSLMAVPKGMVLFRQGDPAIMAHVVTSGTLALYREEKGTRRVVAKAVRGEMLGELAAADGHPRQATAVALEDSTVAIFPAALLAGEGAKADPVTAGLLRGLQNSLRVTHEIYSPRSRHIADSVAEMRTQVAAILGYVQSASAPAGLKAEAGTIAARLGRMTDELVEMIERHPELDRRARAFPGGIDLGAKNEGA